MATAASPAPLPPAPDAPPVDLEEVSEIGQTVDDEGCSSWYDVCWYWWIFGGSGAVCCLCGVFLCCRACVKICTVEIEDPEAAAAAKAAGKPAPKKKKRRASLAEAKRKASVMVTGVDPDAELQRSTTKPLVTKTSMPSIAVMSDAPSAGADPTPPPPPGASGAAPLPPGWEEAADEDGNVFYFNEATGESAWDRPAPLATC